MIALNFISASRYWPKPCFVWSLTILHGQIYPISFCILSSSVVFEAASYPQFSMLSIHRIFGLRCFLASGTMPCDDLHLHTIFFLPHHLTEVWQFPPFD